MWAFPSGRHRVLPVNVLVPLGERSSARQYFKIWDLSKRRMVKRAGESATCSYPTPNIAREELRTKRK